MVLGIGFSDTLARLPLEYTLDYTKGERLPKCYNEIIVVTDNEQSLKVGLLFIFFNSRINNIIIKIIK
jgi:hypothetical protein